MIPRVFEPEVMDTVAEAVDYDTMDHSEVNRVFVEDCLEALGSFAQAAQSPRMPIRGSHGSPPVGFGGSQQPMQVLDVGTGTAQIPIELCRQIPSPPAPLPEGERCIVTAVDMAGEMLKVARRNVHSAGLEDRILLQRVDAKCMPYCEGSFDAVISNSIVHHIPQPRTVLAEMVRVLRPGGLLFVRDLLRPDSVERLDELVAAYAGDANPHQQQMFRDSLHAALTIDELKSLLVELGLPPEWARQTSDRHWTVVGRP